jgi:hypothetical protein
MTDLVAKLTTPYIVENAPIIITVLKTFWLAVRMDLRVSFSTAALQFERSSDPTRNFCFHFSRLRVLLSGRYATVSNRNFGWKSKTNSNTKRRKKGYMG